SLFAGGRMGQGLADLGPHVGRAVRLFAALAGRPAFVELSLGDSRLLAPLVALAGRLFESRFSPFARPGARAGDLSRRRHPGGVSHLLAGPAGARAILHAALPVLW